MTKEEQRVYSLGYQAGVKYQKRNFRKRDEENFKREVFLAVIPFCMTQQDWHIGDGDNKKYITSLDDRISFAWKIARKSLNEF